MKKEEALKRIESLENETKELRKIIETPDRTGKITDRIKNFKDACDELGISGSDLLVKITGMDKDKISIIAYSQLIIIVRALNEGWTPDWSNSKEYKWWPYFNMNSGFGFSDSYTTARARTRMSVPAFALNRKHWQIMQANNSNRYTKNFQYSKS